MLNLIGLLAMLTAVVFGGGGLTVAAAQASLPDQVLYPVKTLSEDVWQSFATSPEAQFDLSLKLAERRISEFEELTRRQQPISVETAANLELHLQNAVRLATQGSPTENQEKLLRIRTTLETQTRALTQIANGQNTETQPLLSQVQAVIREQLRLVEQTGQGPNQPDQAPVPTSANAGETPENSQAPTQGSGAGNPWTDETPTPGSGYGSGQGSNPWTTGTPTPGSGYGSGQGSNPWTTGTPTPGSSYGPGTGTGTCETCVPQENTNPQPGEPNESGGSSQPSQPGGGGKP